MWSDLAVASATHLCQPPFSFYFDLIETVWFAKETNNLPLHRICTLARKQGAKTVLIDPAGHLPAVAADITALDDMHGGGGAAEAIALSFFTCEIADGDDLAAIADTAFLGRAIVINYRPPGAERFAVSYLFEAVLPPPTLPKDYAGPLLNNYLTALADFGCEVRGRPFKVRGVYYCQQNSSTHVCAHACLRMVLKSIDARDITSAEINAELSVSLPCTGLPLGQIASVIEGCGLKADLTDCREFDRSKYLTVLASIIESGDPALLVFTTGNQQGNGATEEHVVAVFGHTRHSDEWHPQAIPVYGGPGSAKYMSAAAWIDHFLIHDDNLGPYYTLSSQALEFDADVRAQWIIAVREHAPTLSANGAEGIAAVMLSNILPVVATLSSGRWFDYITQNTWRYVLRTILTTREAYMAHLLAARGHDGSALTEAEIAPLKDLPDRIWMVEFSLPSLFTGNRAKLGEVLFKAEPDDPVEWDDVYLGARLPNLLTLKGADGEAVSFDHSLKAHSPLFRRTTSGVEW